MNEKKSQSNDSTLRIVLRIVFSLICSLLIWVYVTESVSTDIERPFPGVKVVFEGENAMRDSKGLIVSDTGDTSVKVTLSGTRRAVSSLDSADLTAVIDLSGISKTGNYALAPKITYPNKFDSSAISVAVTNPETISFYIDKLSVVPVPIVGEFNGSAAEGFSAEPLEFDSDSIKIYGPEKIISQIDYALVQISRQDVDKTLNIETTYVLIDKNGKEFDSDEISFDRDTVNVTLPISAVKEVSLIVDFIPGAGATKDFVNWKIVPDSITLTGDTETLAGVNNISLAKIDLSKVDDALTESYKIVLPNDTEATGGEKEAILTLELDGLSKKTVSIDKSNISCTNVSGGYTAEIMNSSLEGVILRGPDNVIHSISAVNVRAVADLTDYGTATGIIAVPVRIFVDGTTDVGAFGEYKVFINVSETVEED